MTPEDQNRFAEAVMDVVERAVACALAPLQQQIAADHDRLVALETENKFLRELVLERVGR
jgi:hypothetical protein